MKERTGMNASRRRMVCKQLKNDWMLYALLLPVLLWYIIFCYLPMGGITLAFRNYRYDMGLWHSPWVGLLHFKTMFQDAEFWRAFSNTLIFSFGKLLFHFPSPFIWISNIWKEFGWDAIIYMAALTAIDPQLYEAASIDGANRLQKMLHITWPGIRSTVCIMLILQVGGIMSGASFDQIFNLYSAPVYPVADIIDTYVYRQSFMTGTNFGYTTAIGLLKSVIGVVMIWTANKVTTKLGEDGLF